MATRYINAMDYADYNAKQVLQKHAKKRPLGELQSKLRYTPAQPVLSCRTVDIDVSGTRTYRSRSTVDIIAEQHSLIHNIYLKAKRDIASAPHRRNVYKSQDNLQGNQNLNIEVKGRPLTSQSQSSLRQQNRLRSGIRRPKTTGGLKNKTPKSDFMVIRVKEKELLNTSREHRKITQQIHDHWQTKNNNLNQGKFVRGQQKSDGPPGLDSWLTFGGVHSEEASGVIDAFAELKNENEYYNIEGGVGSRVAQQLQKGDKIRVGINGSIQSQDLRIKRPESKLEGPRPSESVSQNNNMEKTTIPLCWDDDVSTCKVISPRERKEEEPAPLMSRTRPVVFENDTNDNQVPKSIQKAREGDRQDGFKVKHRKKTRQTVIGQEDENITEITINQSSDYDDLKLRDFSMEDYVKHKMKNSHRESNSSLTGGKSDLELSHRESNPVSARSLSTTEISDGVNLRCASKTSIPDSVFSKDSPRQRSKPSSPLYGGRLSSTDLAITPSSAKMSSDSLHRSTGSNRIGSDKSGLGRDKGSAKSNRPTPAKPLHMTYSTPSSFSAYGPKGDTEFIQITSQIRNPNSYLQSSNASKDQYLTPTASDEALRQVVEQNTPEEEDEMMEEGHQQVPAPSPDIPEPDQEAIPLEQSASPGLSISIPTAEDFNDKDSMLNSPWTTNRDAVNGDDVMTAHSKREAAFRDSQIDQITTLLKGAIVDTNESTLKDREGSASTNTKTVTFNV